MDKNDALLLPGLVLPIQNSFFKELLRKSLHVMIAVVPFIAAWNFLAAQQLLALGIVFYAASERMRFAGVRIPGITRVTELASREGDRRDFAAGPLTLGFGAMIALYLFPLSAAAVGIYALAFGDGLSSLAGKALGKVVLPGTGGKTLAGSTACFLAVFCVAGLSGFSSGQALGIGSAATFLEALPLKDWDNVILPVGTGLAVCLLV